ncbi:MAG: hypothetical protein ACFE9Y_06350 [Promethearchaeota archaeon]
MPPDPQRRYRRVNCLNGPDRIYRTRAKLAPRRECRHCLLTTPIGPR